MVPGRRKIVLSGTMKGETIMERVFFGNRKGPVFLCKNVTKSRKEKSLMKPAYIRILLMSQYI